MKIEMGKKGKCAHTSHAHTHTQARCAGNDRRDLFHFTITIGTLGSVSFVYLFGELSRTRRNEQFFVWAHDTRCSEAFEIFIMYFFVCQSSSSTHFTMRL